MNDVIIRKNPEYIVERFNSDFPVDRNLMTFLCDFFQNYFSDILVVLIPVMIVVVIGHLVVFISHY